MNLLRDGQVLFCKLEFIPDINATVGSENSEQLLLALEKTTESGGQQLTSKVSNFIESIPIYLRNIKYLL